MPLFIDVSTTGETVALNDVGHAHAAATVHREAHGLVADEIHQVREGA